MESNRTLILTVREKQMKFLGYNEEGGLGEFNTLGTYRALQGQGKAAEHPSDELVEMDGRTEVWKFGKGIGSYEEP